MRTALFSLVLLSLLGSATAYAQQDAEDGRATSFERVEGESRESVPGGTFLVLAYALVWVFVLGFVALQWRRAVRLESEVERLRKAIGDRKEAGGGGT